MPTAVCDLADKSCKPCEGGVPPLDDAQVRDMLKQLDGWTLTRDVISKTYSFKNYYQTMAFVNAVAYIAHRVDHHPDLSVHYNRCVVRYSTHDAGGVTLSDCICAALVEKMGL